MIKGIAILAVVAVAAVASQRLSRARSWTRGFAVLALLSALVAGYLAHLGYLGGAVFTDIPATGRGRKPPLAAVLLSGDMGDRVGMGPKIAARLAADGVPVVLVNSLTYFRTTRTADEAATLVTRAAARAMALGHTDRIVLIGQSYGADMLQVAAARLAPTLRRRVALVALAVPGDTVAFRASPSEIFSFDEPEADALPSARQLGWTPTICIHGERETDSLCPRLTNPAIRVVALPGGHPLKHDVDALYAVLRDALTHQARR